MKIYYVSYSRGQLKIQQMAFVLVVLIIFFAIVSLIYFSISLKGLRQGAQNLEDDKAKELVRKLSSSPEFVWNLNECSNCIDLDKVLLLRERKSYKEFWGLDFLQIEKVYPSENGECDKANYPNCGSITIIPAEEFGSPASAFVSLCIWEREKGGYVKCELGRIYASGKGIK